ncbi:MAG: hypothetical protein HY296_08375 [Thaumarchaeota archaeon]|nr:hypothetical protein [Nitrososphaerota archaeon]
MPDGVWRILDNELKGKLGGSRSEVIRSLIVNYLIDEGYVVATAPTPVQRRLASEIATLGGKLAALSQALEDKGLLRRAEWEEMKLSEKRKRRLDKRRVGSVESPTRDS